MQNRWRVTGRKTASLDRKCLGVQCCKQVFDRFEPRHFPKRGLKEAAGARGGRWLWEMNAVFQVPECEIRRRGGLGIGRGSLQVLGFLRAKGWSSICGICKTVLFGGVNTRVRQRAVSTSAVQYRRQHQEVSK